MIVFVASAARCSNRGRLGRAGSGSRVRLLRRAERNRLDDHRDAFSPAGRRGQRLGSPGRNRPAGRGGLAPHRPDPLQPRVDGAAPRQLGHRAQGRRRGRKRAASAPVVNPRWVISPSRSASPRGSGRPTPGPATRADPAAPRVDVDLSQGFTIHSVLLHMHRLGPATSSPSCAPRASARYCCRSAAGSSTGSAITGSAKPVRFNNGDQLQIRCEHRNRTKRNVTWGENSSDEMCIGFVYVSEL